MRVTSRVWVGCGKELVLREFVLNFVLGLKLGLWTLFIPFEF